MNPCWPIEFPLEDILVRYPEIACYLPDGHDPSTIFNRGRQDDLLFGKGLGANQSGKARSEQLRFAIDQANDWNGILRNFMKKPNADELYAMKTRVGLFESKSMKSALEMTSRKIQKIERKKHMKTSEPMAGRISKLVRKGITNAESAAL